jgi:hypothetical protein
MLCKDCPFIFTCWRGEQGEDLMKRNSVTACPDCGRWTVHIMAPLKASAKGNNFHSRIDMHYVFFCEQRSTQENLGYWNTEYHSRGAKHKGMRGAFDMRAAHLHVRGQKIGLVICHVCRGQDQRSPERRDCVINLDKEEFEPPPHWKENKQSDEVQ